MVSEGAECVRVSEGVVSDGVSDGVVRGDVSDGFKVYLADALVLHAELVEVADGHVGKDPEGEGVVHEGVEVPGLDRRVADHPRATTL